MKRYVWAWFPMVAIAFANGALREAGYRPYVGDPWAHLIATALLLAFFTLYVRFIFRRWPTSSSTQAWFVGIVWFALTIAFEFGLGLATGKSWTAMLAEYDLTAGRAWSLIPAWVLVAPTVFRRFRRSA